MSRSDDIDAICRFAGHVSDKRLTSIKEIRTEWERMSRMIFSWWGWDDKAIKDMLEWGVEGHNWKLLHGPGSSKIPYDDLPDELAKRLESFAGEVMYCSDRMSLDRWARCHWYLNEAQHVSDDIKNRPIHEGVAEVERLAEELMGDRREADEWLTAENSYYFDRTPYQVCYRGDYAAVIEYLKERLAK